ncbi:MAG: hypothetical protein CM15mP74_22500 [Halieaceae bacterium]|nr:MAG: hypothetical protein CM15mP74_22500 [Halieaceae bacterium]
MTKSCAEWVDPGRGFGYQLSPDISPDIMVVGKGHQGAFLLPFPGGFVVSHPSRGFLRMDGGGAEPGTHPPFVCASIVGTIEYMLGPNTDTVVRKGGIWRPFKTACSPSSLMGPDPGPGAFTKGFDVVDGNQKPPSPNGPIHWVLKGDLSQHPNNFVAATCMGEWLFLWAGLCQIPSSAVPLFPIFGKAKAPGP